MPYTQDGRLIKVDTPLGADKLLLQRLTGHEGISQLFTFDLDLLAEHATEVDAGKLVGQRTTITLTLPDGTARYINGVIRRFTEAHWDTRFTYYRAEVVPWLWFLTRTADSRIFQNQSVPEIIERIFRDLQLTDYKLQLEGSYAPREYCVQYRERDFDFVSRLMEQYGIFYFFEHTAEKHTLVLADTPDAHKPCPNHAKVRCEITSGMDDTDVVTALRVSDQFHSGAHTLADFNFETPSTTLLASANGVVTRGGNQAYEIYDYPGAYLKRADGEALAKLRAQAEEATHCVISGTSRCRDFASGYRFELQGHERSVLNTAYLLTEVEHAASAGSAYGTGREDEGEEGYENRFVCIPHRVPFRPPRLTPQPIIEGVQTAIVVGPKGEEIHTDKYGRIKVQFHWDREGKIDENSSCWIRVAQGWSGKQWGAIFTPRTGQEVIVDFLEGDPDQPLVTGRVYNAEHMPPYALPEEQTKSTVKTNTSKGGGGFNEIRLEDKKGKEQLFVHAERQQDTRVKKDALEWIGRDRHLIVTRDQLEEVKRDKHLKVTGDHNEQVDGGLSLKVGMDLQRKVGMKRALDAGMEVHLKADMNAVIEGGMTVTLKAGGAFLVVGPTGVAISGMPINVNMGGAAGGGSGASPDAPKQALEADRAKPGEMGKAPPAKTVSPQAAALKQAAKHGHPFCEKCAEAARQAALARGATAEEAEEAAQAAGIAGAAVEEKTFIAIQLVDEDGNPVAGERYQITLPDGDMRRGTLDREGKARIDNLDPGTCDVKFPELRKRRLGSTQ
jgi:type VI secretion system secreted protein VgrG